MRGLSDPGRWLTRIVRSRSGMWILFVFALLEAAFLPLPVEAVMVPYMQMRRDRIWVIAGVTLAAFLLVSLAGYSIGYFLFDEVGLPVLALMGAEEAFEEAKVYLLDHGFWALVVVVVTPVPAPLAMIGGGAVGYPVLPFLAAMILARGMRYLVIAFLVLRFGDRVVRFVTRRRRARAVQPPR